MKRSKFTEEQIIAILREQEAGAKTAEVCRRHGISGATFYAWKAKFGGMEPSEAKRLKALEDENAKLKRPLAERMLDIEPLSAIGPRTMARALKYLLSKNGDARRQAVAHLERGYEMRERRACSLIGADRSSVRYRPRRPDDAALRAALHGAAETHRRFGYRRLHVILRRDGHMLNRKRTQRLYREEGLSVRRRRSRKRALGARAPLVAEALANARWSVDFVQDQFADGRRFRILNVIDDVNKESLAAVVDTSISGRRVARELTALIERRGKLGVIVSDNGTEFTSNAILEWAEKMQVKWHYIVPGKPMRDTASARPSTAGCATIY